MLHGAEGKDEEGNSSMEPNLPLYQESKVESTAVHGATESLLGPDWRRHEESSTLLKLNGYA